MLSQWRATQRQPSLRAATLNGLCALRRFLSLTGNQSFALASAAFFQVLFCACLDGLQPGSIHPACLGAGHFPDFLFLMGCAVAPPLLFMTSLHSNSHTNTTVGKYLVSPLTRQLDDGRFAASVSIRSGKGSHTHDRVLRLDPVFADHIAAAHYATSEGLQWIRHRHAPSVQACPMG